MEEQDSDAAKLTAAETAIEKHDYADAEALLKEVVSNHPNNNVAWYDLGFVFHALGRRDESMEAYREAVQAKPDVFESNLNLGMILAQAGKPDAEQYLRAATKLTPTSNPAQGHKSAWLALGHVLETAKPEEAIKAFREAAVADPKDPEPHLLAGWLLEKQKSPAAEQEYQLALAIDPQSPDALAALTNLYMAQHRFADAETLLRKLLVIHPNDASVHFQLGRMLAIAGKNEDAANELAAGLKLDPSDDKAQRDLADLYTESGKYDQAHEIYTRLLAAYPDDPGLHQAIGRLFLKQKKFPEAEQELMRTVQLKPGDGEVYGDLAFAANENKDYPLAIKAIDLRGQYLPENPMTYFLRATAYDHLRDVKQASKYYHEFLNSAGGNYPVQEWQATHRLIAIEPKK
jgi:Flp pilus assembly protein TadD